MSPRIWHGELATIVIVAAVNLLNAAARITRPLRLVRAAGYLA